MMNGPSKLYTKLNELNINFDYFEHEEVPTIESAIEVKKNIPGIFCKNLFFRNHKGKKHFLVLLHHAYQLDIKILESLLKQGKLSFASEKRLDKYLGLKPGSVSPFGLINDREAHVHVFIDSNLKNQQKLSFHPTVNNASLLISTEDLIKFIDDNGNSYEFIDLY